MKVSRVSVTGVLLAGVVVLGSAAAWPGQSARAQTHTGGAALAEAIPPHFEADPSFLGSIPTNTGANHYITVDSKGNIYNSRLQTFVFKGVPTLNELLKR